MSAYTQKQLERLDAFIARKRASKEAATKRFMQGFRQESESSMLALVIAVVPVALLMLVVLFILLISSCNTAHAEEISEKLAVRAIVGEASSEGLSGMRCVASAIRNRGTLKGVYGLHAKHVDREPKWVFNLARQAWRESAKKDFVCQASFWEGKSFTKPYWTKNMVLVKSVGNQNFYKPKGRI